MIDCKISFGDCSDCTHSVGGDCEYEEDGEEE